MYIYMYKKIISDDYRSFENRNRFEVRLKYKFTTSSMRNALHDHRANSEKLTFWYESAYMFGKSENDKEKRKQKCYGLTSTREFLKKYAHRERLKTF